MQTYIYLVRESLICVCDITITFYLSKYLFTVNKHLFSTIQRNIYIY